jgi:hypothetical protein
MPKLVTCITLEFSYVLILSYRLSTGKIIELSLIYLAGKRNILIVNLVLASI